MKKLLTAIGYLGFLFICSTATASVIDAPHNETNNIKCGDCHAYSLWWKYSPAANEPNYDVITDDVCNSCHDGSNSLIPTKIPHNWESMAEMHKVDHGNWQTSCVNCHDPHHQTQLYWVDTNLSELFLVTGSIAPSSISQTTDPITQLTTTTFEYIDADAHNNRTIPSKWGAKSGPDRGLILVVAGVEIDDSTYEINNATETVQIMPGSTIGSGTITVQGEIPTASEGKTFGIIYGQLLKYSINAPDVANGVNVDRFVKLFDPETTFDSGEQGGLTDSLNSPTQGVCQVCHYNTKYYNYDGYQPLGTGDTQDPLLPAGRMLATEHNPGTPCAGCHPAAEGFKPINADHTFLTVGTTTCIGCHNDADIVLETHNGNCVNCHTNPPTLRDEVSTGTNNKWPSTPHAAGTCADCHDGDGPGIYNIMANFLNHPKANDHTNQVTAAPNCTSNCHFHNLNDPITGITRDIITDIHAQGGTDPCVKCHNLADGSGHLQSKAVAGAGDCKNCHTERAADWTKHPNVNDHTTQVYAFAPDTDKCTRCHTGDPINVIHRYNCGDCHDGLTGSLRGLTWDNGPGNCIECHTTHAASFYSHDPSLFHDDSSDHVLSGAVTSDPACTQCHIEADMTVDIHKTNGCATCHDNEGYLIGLAAGHPASTTTPNTCSTCHTGRESHPADTDHSITIGAVATCVSCHSGDLTAWIHNSTIDANNACLPCHPSLHTDEIRNLAPGVINNGDCVTCHDSVGTTSIFDQDHIYENDHTGQVDGDIYDASVRTCQTSGCHEGIDPARDVHWLGGPCYACHDVGGPLIGSAAGRATGKKPLSGAINGCVDCHSDALDYQDPVVHPNP